MNVPIVQPYYHQQLRKHYLIIVLVEHDDNLSHVVEFRHGTEIIHGTLPLLIVLLLLHTNKSIFGLNVANRSTSNSLIIVTSLEHLHALTSSKPP